MDNLLSTTTTISEYLSSDYNITSHISALAYKNELSASEICGYQDTTYTSGRYIGISGDDNVIYVSADVVLEETLSDTIALSNENQVVDLIERNSSKVFINDMVKGVNYGKLDLSVVKIPLSDYELSVVGGTLSDNILYITEEDYLDMYGRQICSLTMSDNEMEKYEGVAATKTYIDTKIQEIKESIIKAAETISASLEAKDEMKTTFE